MKIEERLAAGSKLRKVFEKVSISSTYIYICIFSFEGYHSAVNRGDPLPSLLIRTYLLTTMQCAGNIHLISIIDMNTSYNVKCIYAIKNYKIVSN